MRLVLQAVIAASLLLAALGCKPEIGDKCDLDADCSNAGDRLCDRTQPGGYCTVFNCEPGTCPDEATCIGFRTTVSALATEDGPVTGWTCSDPQQSSRLQRAFCMRRCKSNGDCRSGYECLDMRQAGNPYGAVVLEDGGSGKVCAVPNAAEPLTFGGEGVPGVCTGDPGGSIGGAPGVATEQGGASGGAVAPQGGGSAGGLPGGKAGADAGGDGGNRAAADAARAGSAGS
jgi:hypothetical protein